MAKSRTTQGRLRRILAAAAIGAAWLAAAPGAAQTPAQKIEQASRIFASLCAEALPSMSGLEPRVEALSRQLFDNSGGVNQPGTYVQGGSIAEGVGFGVGSPAWRDSGGLNFCRTTVYNVPRQEALAAVLARFEAAKPASVTLSRRAEVPRGVVAAWDVAGAQPGMVLQAVRQPRKGTRFELAWGG